MIPDVQLSVGSLSFQNREIVYMLSEFMGAHSSLALELQDFYICSLKAFFY